MFSAPLRWKLVLICLALFPAPGCGDLEKDRICLNGPCPQQSKECRNYVACYEATGGSRGSLDSSYGANGTCWSTTLAVVEACTAACASALPSLKSAYPDAGCK